MKDRIVGFIDALRQAGVPCTPSESIDAARATAVAGIERPVLRESLAATLVKDHGDRPIFDEVFERYFGLPAAAGGARRKRSSDGEGIGGEGTGRGRGRESAERRGGDRDRHEQERGEQQRDASRLAEKLAARRVLLSRPFRDMDPRDVEAVRELVAELSQRFRSRWSRRLRRAPRGRLDMRRTIRRSMGRGGVPIELLLRRPRPGKSDLLALVDLSHSTTTAAQFLLALLVPARRFFRRVDLLAYVDTAAQISYEGGHMVPHEALDLNARSDFGRVLVQVAQRFGGQIGRNTVLLILGDARNNRRPPRSDVLAALHDKARAIFWLNPEPRHRWDTGDSVMSAYARHCDTVLAAHDLRSLLTALSAFAKRVT